MKKAWRTTKGKCATYSSLTFESHELFRLCSIATVIFFLFALSALLQNLADSRSHRDHRGFLSLVSVWVSITMDDHAKTINCPFPFFKNRKPEYRQDVSPARLRFEDVRVPYTARKEHLKKLMQLFS